MTGHPRSPSLTRFTGVLDQAIASASNIVVVIAAGRFGDALLVGRIAIVLGYWNVILAVARGALGESLQVSEDVHTQDVARSALAIGLLAAVPPALFGVWMTILQNAPAPDDGHLAVVLAIGIPALVGQDVWRWVHFKAGAAARAVTNDLMFLVVQIIATLALMRVWPVGVATVAGWSVGAYAGSIVGYIQSGTVVRHPSLAWVGRNRDIAKDLTAEGVARHSVSFLFVAVAGLMAGSAALGTYRAMQTLVGIGNVILNGLTSVALAPARARYREAGRAGLRRTTHGAGAALAFASVAFCVVVLVFLEPLTVLLYGPSSSGWLKPVALPTTLQFVATSIAFVPLVAVRAMHRTGLLTVARVASGVLGLALAALLMKEGSASSVAWTALLVTVLGTSTYHLAYRHAARRDSTRGTCAG